MTPITSRALGALLLFFFALQPITTLYSQQTHIPEPAAHLVDEEYDDPFADPFAEEEEEQKLSRSERVKAWFTNFIFMSKMAARAAKMKASRWWHNGASKRLGNVAQASAVGTGVLGLGVGMGWLMGQMQHRHQTQAGS